MGSIPRVAVVVVNFGSSDLLAANLAPLTRDCPGLVAVVVDNRSSESEARRVALLAAHEGWELVSLERNRGFGAGVNVGVARAREMGRDIFLLLNPDARIACSAVGVLADRIADAPLTMICPVIERPDGSPWFRGGLLDLEHGRTRSGADVVGLSGRPQWLTGACMITGAAVWDLTGGFDEDYFLYWEDVDLSIRAARVGVDLVVATDARAVHDEGGTQDRQGRPEDLSDGYYYFNIRNRNLFAAKNLPAMDRQRWLRRSVPESYRILCRGDGRRKFLRPWRPLSIGFRGIRDGWRSGRAAVAASGGPK
jgi:N-acetylglucosaminyl-diphospho-decaprenol L-rhamnosyltransferase